MVVTGPWGRRTGKAIGERGVAIFDTSSAEVFTENSATEKKSSNSKISGVRISRISAGDLVDLQTLAIIPAPYKTSIQESNEVEVEISKDIFNADATFEFDKIAKSLLASAANETYGLSAETVPMQVKVSIGKNWEGGGGDSAQARAAGFGGVDPETGKYGYSYQNMWMAVQQQLV